MPGRAAQRQAPVELHSRPMVSVQHVKFGASSFGADLSGQVTVELAQRAEAAGFERFMLVERVETNDVLVQLAAVAASTSTIGLGTGIANIYLRRPAMLAAGAIAVADVSGGRLVLGLGPNNRNAVERLGLQWQSPEAALTELTAQLRSTFTGTPGALGGCGPCRHPIPMPWAAVGLQTAAAAGRHADGVMAYLATVDRLGTVLGAVRLGAETAGRDPDQLEYSLLLPTFLDDDLQVARAAARRFLTMYAGMDHYRRMFESSGFTDVASVPDSLIDAVVLAGSAERCRQRLGELAEVGLTHIDLAPLPVGDRDLPASFDAVLTALRP